VSKMEQPSSPVTRTRMTTTFKIRPLSLLLPSGLAGSPLLRIGLVLRLLGVELAAELLLKPGLSRLGIMRTMAGGAGWARGFSWIYCSMRSKELPGFQFRKVGRGSGC
jgi:hypothetical protein